MKIKRFEELPIWRLSLKITKVIYDLTSLSKFRNDFALRDQIRRAVISVSSNIVEGFEKNNNNEFIRFLKIAKGSAGETRSQIHIALAVGYVTKEEFNTVDQELENLANQIGGFISYLEKCRSEGKFKVPLWELESLAFRRIFQEVMGYVMIETLICRIIAKLLIPSFSFCPTTTFRKPVSPASERKKFPQTITRIFRT